MKVGDVAIPNRGVALRSGHCEYSCAVVVSINPFILVSGSTDMLWRTMQPSDFYVNDVAALDILEDCMARLYRDYPNHKLHQFMDTKIDET